MFFSYEHIQGCCGIYVLSDCDSRAYQHYYRFIDKKNRPPNKGWDMHTFILNIAYAAKGLATKLQAHIIFTHAAHQNRNNRSPKSFAEWLRAEGESVLESRPASGNYNSELIAYTWTPSQAFKDRFKAELAQARALADESIVKAASKGW